MPAHTVHLAISAHTLEKTVSAGKNPYLKYYQLIRMAENEKPETEAKRMARLRKLGGVLYAKAKMVKRCVFRQQ